MDPIELKKRIEAAAAHGNAADMIAYVRNEQAKRFASDVWIARFGLSIASLMCGGFGAGLAYAALDQFLVGSTIQTLPFAFFSFVLLAIAAVIGAFAFLISPPPIALAHGGIRAKATIEDYRSAFGSFSVGDHSGRRSLTRVAIDLAVSPSEGGPYRVTVKQHLSMNDFAALRVGKTVDAFVDRADPKRVLLVLE